MIEKQIHSVFLSHFLTSFAFLSICFFSLQSGRIEPHYPKVCGHQGNVLDIKWNPFIDNIIASCSEDSSVSWTVEHQYTYIIASTHFVKYTNMHFMTVGISKDFLKLLLQDYWRLFF